MRLFCVAGASGTGKTTLLERLLDHLPTDRSRVGLVKHTHHELDWHPPAKDSTKYWEAGAGAVVVIDPVQIASFARATADSKPPSTRWTDSGVSESLLQTRSLLGACCVLPPSIEIVLAEGWSRSLVPKVWFAGGSREELSLDQIPEVRAIISAGQGPKSSAAYGALPVYKPEDVDELASRIWNCAAPVSELREAAAAAARRESRAGSPS